MRGAWGRRIKETVAIVAVKTTRQHPELWEVGPEGIRKVARFFAANPYHVRLLDAWLAPSQHRAG